MLGEIANSIQEVLGITRKARNTFCDNEVDLSGFGIRHHLVESVSVLQACAAYTLIRVDLYQFPFFMLLNEFFIVGLLQLE